SISDDDDMLHNTGVRVSAKVHKYRNFPPAPKAIGMNFNKGLFSRENSQNCVSWEKASKAHEKLDFCFGPCIGRLWGPPGKDQRAQFCGLPGKGGTTAC